MRIIHSLLLVGFNKIVDAAIRLLQLITLVFVDCRRRRYSLSLPKSILKSRTFFVLCAQQSKQKREDSVEYDGKRNGVRFLPLCYILRCIVVNAQEDRPTHYRSMQAKGLQRFRNLLLNNLIDINTTINSISRNVPLIRIIVIRRIVRRVVKLRQEGIRYLQVIDQLDNRLLDEVFISSPLWHIEPWTRHTARLPRVPSCFR